MRRGFALATALLALVCASALLAALAFAAREEIVLAGLAHHAQVALTTAERAAWSAAASLDSADLRRQPGSTRAVSLTAAPADSISASVTRLEGDLFLAVGEALAGQGRRYGRRRVGLLVRVVVDSLGSASWAPLAGRNWVDMP